MAEHMKYATSKPSARVPELLFLLDMLAAARERHATATACEQSPLNYSEAQDVYYDHRTFGPLLYFFVHSSPLYRELLLLDEEETPGRQSD
ncbi:MAG: hypothetical protein JXB04_11715 [Kiritimatiellae bacterium]|nr:hypothetical protein [Kiritimatiellia bacterium]